MRARMARRGSHADRLGRRAGESGQDRCRACRPLARGARSRAATCAAIAAAMVDALARPARALRLAGRATPMTGRSEFAARNAWEQLLEEFARIGTVDTADDGGDRIAGAAQSCGPQHFPAGRRRPPRFRSWASSKPRVMPFDALWVAGLSAQRWPPAPQPNPFLPLPHPSRRSSRRRREESRRVTSSRTPE